MLSRILDVFMISESGKYGFYVVFEVWGIMLETFRTLHGYGREDAQPSRHIRNIVEHTSKALYFLHDQLGLIHTDVTLSNIIVQEETGSLSRAISCKLGGFTLLEEARPHSANARRFQGWHSQRRVRTCFIRPPRAKHCVSASPFSNPHSHAIIDWVGRLPGNID